MSKGYTAKANAEKAVVTVTVNVATDRRYARMATAAGYSFTLQAANGATVGRSEVYTTAAARDKCIESLKANAPGAAVVDLT